MHIMSNQILLSLCMQIKINERLNIISEAQVSSTLLSVLYQILEHVSKLCAESIGGY